MFQVEVGNFVSLWACVKYSGDAWLWWVIVAIACGVVGGIILLLVVILSVVIARRRNRRLGTRRPGQVVENRLNNVSPVAVVKVSRRKNKKVDNGHDMVTKNCLKRNNGDGENSYKREIRSTGGTYARNIGSNVGSYSRSIGGNGSADIELQEGGYSRHLGGTHRGYDNSNVGDIDTMNGKDLKTRHLKARGDRLNRHVGQPPGDNNHTSESVFDKPDYSDNSGSDNDKASETPSYFRNIGARDTFYTKRLSSILQTEVEPETRSSAASYFQATQSARGYNRNIQPYSSEKSSHSNFGPKKYSFDGVSGSYSIFERDKKRPLNETNSYLSKISSSKLGTEKSLPSGQMINMPFGSQHLTKNSRGNVPGLPRSSDLGGFYGSHAISVPSNRSDLLESKTIREDVSPTNEINSSQKPPNRLVSAFQKIFQSHTKKNRNDDTL